jgi:hypothetical protein
VYEEPTSCGCGSRISSSDIAQMLEVRRLQVAAMPAMPKGLELAKALVHANGPKKELGAGRRASAPTCAPAPTGGRKAVPPVVGRRQSSESQRRDHVLERRKS